MIRFGIWMEGYAATGESAGASFVGESTGEDFKDACQNWYKNNPDPYYSKENNSYWGCRLFDNQTDAMKTFG